MDDTPSSPSLRKRNFPQWGYYVILLYILIAGAYFRFSGLFWGEYQYLHPDERFLVWVGTDISPVNSLGEYFNTEQSSLNPHNRGHGFYVYGTLPMFLTRYLVEWIFGISGFDEMTQVGRTLSALVDLLAVLLVYMVAVRLYNRRVGILAAAFSAAAVCQIQQSHFFTMDTFMNAFSFLAFTCAVWIVVPDKKAKISTTNREEDDQEASISSTASVKEVFRQFIHDPLFLPSFGFGIAFGMAMASKINAAPMAFALPAAMLLHLLQIPDKKRNPRAAYVLAYLVMAGLLSILVFRLLQPYAFSGPGFLNITPNPHWLDNLRSLQAQSSGDVDFPPAMQWARRPVWFSFQNMVWWGLGLPFGILAWSGFVWVGWRLLSDWKSRRTEWLHHTLIWGWTAIYFTWQSLIKNPTMRYQLPIYPTLAIFAGWAIISIYDLSTKRKSSDCEIDSEKLKQPARRWAHPLAIILAVLALLSSFAYAFGFSRIYTKNITRITASRWIYNNIPGPISLSIQTEDGIVNQSLPVPYKLVITPGAPYSTNFHAIDSGMLSQVTFPRIVDEFADPEEREIEIEISSIGSEVESLGAARVITDLSSPDDPRGQSLIFNFPKPVILNPEQTYNLRIQVRGEIPPAVAIDGELTLNIEPDEESSEASIVTQSFNSVSTIIRPSAPFILEYTSPIDGFLSHIDIGNISQQDGGSTPKSFLVTNYDPAGDSEKSSTAFAIQNTSPKQGYSLALESAIPVSIGEQYILAIETLPEGGAISLSGLGIANEGEWDDGLPLRLDGYDGYGGIYPLDLEFNMYWDDNPDKLTRFLRILDEADYIVISSSRQWGSLPRMPERFPLTTTYYRALIGCPADQQIEYCYNVAEPGKFEGELGYELIATFTSDPGIGHIKINDQFAEEAFTVYDHPKVFIFKKNTVYDPQVVGAILGKVDFFNIVRIPPMQMPSHPANLLLPDDRLAEQRQGGTWSQFFDTEALQNRFPFLSVILWYLTVSLLGFVTYPILRFATPGLADRGYPLARITGLLLLSYIVWIAGSFRIPFSPSTISVVFVGIAVVSFYLVYLQRKELRDELGQRWIYFLIVEGLVLLLFIGFLLVRIGNPDLWHPWKGGEKPMDFSYFNAVLKSTTFPPYDPWFAGGYLNYYYYGFVLVGVLTKWLGIVPSVAYNLILPTLFSMIFMGAFSVAWNLSQKNTDDMNSEQISSSRISKALPIHAFIPAFVAGVGMAIIGNLGTVRMFFQGYQRLVAPDGVIEDANFITRLIWAMRGFAMTIQNMIEQTVNALRGLDIVGRGIQLPYSAGDWYWLPSRAIPAPGDVEPITEFPYFTILYADLHAHLLALPLTLLALSLIIAIVLGKARWKSICGEIVWFILAGLAIGSLRPTNTWDLPPYLVLGVIAVGYSTWRYFRLPESAEESDSRSKTSDYPLRLFRTIAGIIALVGLTFIFYQPYAQWYALGYTKIDLWKGTHTNFNAYFVHWGLFLFLITSWTIWETRDWMAKTPMSALRTLGRFRLPIQIALVTLVLIVGTLLWFEVYIAWFVLPLALWTGILILRPNQSDAKRIVLFLIGSGLMLTLMVEVIVLKGDIGRMNTVFKFYLQVWTFFSICAATAFGWLVSALPEWLPGWRKPWVFVFIILTVGALLFPIFATLAKIEDRMESEASHTLDGMDYMQFAEYTDEWGTMDLSQDYRAIRWMQENIEASPVIVEANLRDLYRWGSRYSIYTGLPGVTGWEWHQQQQRAVVPGTWISSRIAEIDDFYLTVDWDSAANFLRKYDVRYVIVGQQERGKYPSPGLDKFEDAEGILWEEVYRESDTVIYEVIL